MKIYQKSAPRKDGPDQDDLGSLTKEQTRRIVRGLPAVEDGSNVVKRHSIPKAIPFLDLNFPARRRVS